nr:MAG: capsid protein [Wufeng shrew picorna-like virus 23]
MPLSRSIATQTFPIPILAPLAQKVPPLILRRVPSTLQRIPTLVGPPRQAPVMSNPDLNPIGALHELLASAKLDFDSSCCSQCFTRSDEDGLWDCTLSLAHDGAVFSHTSHAATKQTAKSLAFRGVYAQLAPILSVVASEIRSNISLESMSKITSDLAYKMIDEHLSISLKLSKHFKQPICVHVIGGVSLPYESVVLDDIPFSYQRAGRDIYVLSRTSQSFVGSKGKAVSDIYFLQPRTYRSEDGLKTFVHYDTVANSGPPDRSIEPVAQVGVQDNPGTMTIPHLPNPQPTAVTPAMAVQDPSLVSALEPLLPHELLNPIGPPNMLGVGGITFDIKDLIYSQYLDCDVQYQYTDDTPQGQIIFQIPYDPTSQYVNPYIRQWLSMHPRYTGALNYRFTVIGNATFSGLIGFAWYPRAIQSNTVKVSEMMKYSYTSMGVNEPSNRIFTLFDARQTKFWRDTSDPDTDNPRPVLVCFVYMTAVSPLKEGITIRIRVASKLSDGSDGPAFVAAEPTLPALKPGVGAPSPTGLDISYIQLLTGMPFYPVIARPLQIGSPMYLYTDGLVYKPYLTSSSASDLNNLPASRWGGAPISTSSSVVSIAYRFSFDTNLSILGVYTLDMSKSTTLAYIQNSVTPDVNPIQQAFYKQYNATTKDWQPLDLLVPIISQYVKIYQIINYTCVIGSKQPYFGYFAAKPDSPYSTVPYNVANMACIQTAAGPIFVSLMQCTKTFVDPNTGVAGTISMPSLAYDELVSVTQISQSFPQPGWTPESMPLGWRNITCSTDVPFVTPKSYTSFQGYNHPSVQSIFSELALRTTPTQCVQLSLTDLDSGSDLAVLRFYPDRRALVVNFGPTIEGYINATLVRPSNRIYIGTLDIVERSNAFPISNILNFVENTAGNTMHLRRELLRKAVYDPSKDGVITPNAAAVAAIAGGGFLSALGSAAQGVGQYFISKEEREFYYKVFGEQQANKFEMQSNQNSFLSALSAQGAGQQLHNAKEIAAFQQELAGYRTPGAVAGLNRAGLGYPGASYSPQTTSTGKIAKSTQTGPNGVMPKTRNPNNVGIQTDKPSMADAGSQTMRPPGTAMPSGNHPTSNFMRQPAMTKKEASSAASRRGIMQVKGVTSTASQA